MIRLLIVKQRSGPLSDSERSWAVRYIILSLVLATAAWGTLWREVPVSLAGLPGWSSAVLPLLHLITALAAGILKKAARGIMLSVHGIFLTIYYLASLMGIPMLGSVLPPWALAACIILILGMHAALLTNSRGLIFGYSSSSTRKAAMHLRKVHHVITSPAVIILAWFSPLEHESFSLLRFGIAALLLFHLGMAGTTLHRSIWWNTLVELSALALLAVSPEFMDYLPVLLVSAGISFTCTGLYGLRWSRMAHMIIQGALIALLAWSLIARGAAGLWQPLLLPLTVYAAAALLLTAAAVTLLLYRRDA